MKFHAISEKGYCPDLDAAALGMGLPGKMARAVTLLQRSALIGLGSPGKAADVAGNEMPRLWNQGHQQHVLDYLAQDARILADLAATCQERRALKWISDSCHELEIRLPEGWLIAKEAANLPGPDTSGANCLVSRRETMDWLAR